MRTNLSNALEEKIPVMYELLQNAFRCFYATKTRRLLELVDGLVIRHLSFERPSLFCHSLVHCLIVDRSAWSLVHSTTHGASWVSVGLSTTTTMKMYELQKVTRIVWLVRPLNLRTLVHK
jgi:hypothetical protein